MWHADDELRCFFQETPRVTKRRYRDSEDGVTVIERSDLTPSERKQVLLARAVSDGAQHATVEHPIEDRRCVNPEVQFLGLMHELGLCPFTLSVPNLSENAMAALLQHLYSTVELRGLDENVISIVR